MRALFLAAALAGLSACATAPPPESELQLAQEVFQLSGGFEEARAIARFGVPFALSDIDGIGERCRRSMGGNNILAAAACEVAVSALKAAQGDREQLARTIDRQLDTLEGRAAQALMDTYSYDELVALRRFYSSPEGRSIVAKRGEFWAALLRS